MFATLPSATADQPVFSVANLVILIVAAAILYPLQKKLREAVSRRRRERWAEEERLTGHQPEPGDRPAPDDEQG